MKKLFALYVFIGLMFTPFVYSNNAQDFRDGSSGTKWGHALGGSFYWPSYLFSIEPEADGTSADSFEKSLIDIVNYRNDKLFTGKRSKVNGLMVYKALGNCLAFAGADKKHILNLYEEIFSRNQQGEEINRIKLMVMEQFDGFDFADIIKAGAECGESLKGQENSPLSGSMEDYFDEEAAKNSAKSK